MSNGAVLGVGLLVGLGTALIFQWRRMQRAGFSYRIPQDAIASYELPWSGPGDSRGSLEVHAAPEEAEAIVRATLQFVGDGRIATPAPWVLVAWIERRAMILHEVALAVSVPDPDTSRITCYSRMKFPTFSGLDRRETAAAVRYVLAHLIHQAEAKGVEWRYGPEGYPA